MQKWMIGYWIGVTILMILMVSGFIITVNFKAPIEEGVAINYGDACINEYLGKGYNNESTIKLCDLREVNKDG